MGYVVQRGVAKSRGGANRRALAAGAMALVGCWVIAILMAIGLTARGSGAHDEPGATDAAVFNPESVIADVRSLPSSVELVIGLDDAAALRGRSVGRAVERFLESSGVLKDLSPSAIGLAKELGLSERELFDALVGRRVVLATRQANSVREWALMSRVSLETERRLRERLAASPRSIDAGHQVLSIERGAYMLVVHREDGKAYSTVVLAPGDRDGLMREIVLAFSKDWKPDEGRPGRLGEIKSVTESLAHAAQAFASAGLNRAGLIEEGGEAPESHGGLVVLARLDDAEQRAEASSETEMDAQGGEAKAAAALPWSRLVTLVGAGGSERIAGDDRGWRCGVVVRRTSSGGEIDRGLPVIAKSTDAIILSLESDSVLAAVESPGASALLQSFNFPRLDLLSMIPLPESAKNLITGRRAFWVRAMTTRDRVTIGVAMETIATDELAKSMDGAIARFVKSLEERFGTFDTPPVDVGGAAPEAIRVLPIRMPEGGVPLISTEPLVASWNYVRAVEAKAKEGWWALQVAQHAPGDTPSPEDVFARDAAKFGGEERVAGSVEGRWAFLASAKPRELERVLSKSIPDVRGFRGMMRGFDEFRVRLRAGEAGELVGDVSLRLADNVGDGGVGR